MDEGAITMPTLRRNSDLADWLEILEAALVRYPHNVAVLIDYAHALLEGGRTDEAETQFRAVLQIRPEHYGANSNLISLLAGRQQYSEALACAHAFLAQYPNDAAAHVSCGMIHFFMGELELARTAYERVLELAPEDAVYKNGMSMICERLNDTARAKSERAAAAAYQGFRVMQHRGSAAPVRVLLLVSRAENDRSFSFDYALDDHRPDDDHSFQLVRYSLDDLKLRATSPPVHLIINGMADDEKSDKQLVLAARALRKSAVPVVNAFEAVRQTGRVVNAARFAAIPGVRSARMAGVTHKDLASKKRAALLERLGFAYPFLIRAPGFCAGRQFYYVENDASLDTAIDAMDKKEYILIEYIDTRDAQGLYRKYRMLLIDGRQHPLHLALSDHWKVHYFSTDMATRPDLRAVEAEFLSDPQRAMGEGAVTAIQAVGESLGLDYCGVDYGFDRSGKLVVFEANGAMSIVRPGNENHWAYRRTASNAALAATGAMLTRRARQGLEQLPAPQAVEFSVF